jgi:hypothetical protein
VSYSANWLNQYFLPKIQAATLSRTLIVLTYDEGEDFGPNQIYTVLIGDTILPGTVVSSKTDHYGLLRLIETELGLGNLGNKDQTAAVISGIWK